MTVMNKLPTVISCCFCCFLRAGTVMISIISFVVGLFFAPNVTYTKGFWDIDPVLSYYSSATENAIRMTLGVVSVMLCVVSVALLIGAICNSPVLIEIYQWGALLYCVVIFFLFLVLAIFCFFIHSNSVTTGIILIVLVILCVLITTYFIIVTNSLRMSLRYISGAAV